MLMRQGLLQLQLGWKLKRLGLILLRLVQMLRLQVLEL